MQKSVLRTIQHEPGASSAEQEEEVLRLAVVSAEVLEARLGNGDLNLSGLLGLDPGDFVDVTLTKLAASIGLDVKGSLFYVSSHIEGVARGLGDGETEIKSEAARHSTEPNQGPPHFVDGDGADASAGGIGGGRGQRLLEAESDEQHDESSDKLADTLHGENGTHHGTTPFGGCKSTKKSAPMILARVGSRLIRHTRK